MPSPICVKDRVEMQCVKTGALICLDTFEGTKEVPYQIFSTDIYGCGLCGGEVAIRAPFAQPVSEHFEPEFASYLERVKPEHHVRP